MSNIIPLGVVTGADKFFIMNEDALNKMHLDASGTIPILNNGMQLRGFTIDGNLPDKLLIVIKPKISSPT